MRLIDADALQAEYKQYHDGKRLLLIDTAPTIEPRPRGKWIERWHNNQHVIGDMACSVCGAQMLLTFPMFCPCCGAYMREEEQNENT